MYAHTSLIKAPAILYDALTLFSNSHGNIRANSVSSIKESVSAIEAFMNELGELGRGYESCGHSEKSTMVRLGKGLRDAEANRDSIKQKVQIACETLSGTKLIKGQPIYQKFSLVVDIRNELAHPKASIISLSEGKLLPPKREQKLIRQIMSYGFSCPQDSSHDWTSAISNRSFAEWAHLSVVDMMIYIFSFWPYPDAIDSYMNVYGLNRYKK